MGILAFIIIGLLAGLIARAIVPGRQSMGIVSTILLGIVGSFIGGLINSLFHRGEFTRIQPSGIILSVIGSIVVLLIVGWARGHRRVHV